MSAFLEMSSADFRRKFIDKNYTEHTGVNKKGFKRSKYGSKKTTVGDIVYDSRKEAARGEALSNMKNVKYLVRQKKFRLIDPFEYRGQKIRETCWIADFYYYDEEIKEWVAEDVKSEITRKNAEYRIKKKLFMRRYPEILFREIV